MSNKSLSILSSTADAVAENVLPKEIGDVAQAAIKLGIDELAKPKTASATTNVGSLDSYAPKQLRFILGKKSLVNLGGVHPMLVRIVRRAIEITEQDFTVFEGLRSAQRQRQLKATGMSQTLDSYHLVQRSGYGHAVDLVPVINRIVTWDWDGCFKVACAMDKAASELRLDNQLVWGAVWDCPMSVYGSNSGRDIQGIKAAVENYKERHPGKDFLDGPHFQFAR